jgi:flagellum-specific peptidoglycan hydrolase FlgJ
MKKKEFLDKYSDAVIRATSGTELYPSVKMAQMIVESGWGSSKNAILANNMFGIKKGVGWTGQTLTLNTPNDANKKSVFRKYDSPEDSIRDHTSFLVANPRYKKNGVFSATSPEAQAYAIEKSGYAEALNYGDYLITLIRQNNLKQLDKKQKVNPFAKFIFYSPLVFFFSLLLISS